MRPLLVAFLLAACDVVEPLPNPVDPPAGCGNEAQLFGPCAPGATCADETLACVELADGAACLPLGGVATDEMRACAAQFGSLSCSPQFNLCAVVCPGGLDGECGGGMACDSAVEACVWPGGVPEYGTTGEPPTTTTNPTSTG